MAHHEGPVGNIGKRAGVQVDHGAEGEDEIGHFVAHAHPLRVREVDGQRHQRGACACCEHRGGEVVTAEHRAHRSAPDPAHEHEGVEGPPDQDERGRVGGHGEVVRETQARAEAHPEGDAEGEDQRDHHVRQPAARPLDCAGDSPQCAVRGIMARSEGPDEHAHEDRQQRPRRPARPQALQHCRGLGPDAPVSRWSEGCER